MPYRKLKLVLWVALGTYLSTGLILGFSHRHQEIFPFFSWSLFSKVHTQRTDFGVMLVRVNGEQQEPPIDLMSARGVVHGAGTIGAYWTLQKLGPALLSRTPQRYEPLRETFEASYLTGPSQLTYAVVLRRWDPIDRFRQGTIKEKEVVRLERQ